MTSAPLAVAVPLVGAGFLAATNALASRRLAEVVSLASAAATAVLTGVVLAQSLDATVVHWLGGWLPRGEVALGISLTADPIAAGLAAFVSFLMVVAFVLSARYVDAPNHLFHALMLTFLAAMVAFAFSGDLFTMFVFFELMGVSAYALAGYRAERRAPLEGSLNFAITNSVGAFLLLTGIALLYARTGALNLAQIGAVLGRAPADGLVVVAFVLVASGFFVKAAVVPFHFWLADAYAVAPAAVCILFAGAMSELGLYAVARVYWTIFHAPFAGHEAAVQAALIGAGMLTALVGALMSLAQRHLKRLLAFATVSYVGLFLIGIGLLTAEGLAGAAVYVVADGLVKAALFTCVGILEHRRRHLDQRRLHGTCRDLPFTGVVFALGALALAALPPFGTFLGKALIGGAASDEGLGWLPAFIALTSALTSAAVLRAAGAVFLGVGPSDPGGEPAEDEITEPETAEHERTPPTMIVPAIVLLFAALAAGVWTGLADAATAAAQRFIDAAAYAGAVLHGAPGTIPGRVEVPAPVGIDYVYAAAATVGAVALAALLLLRPPRRSERPPVRASLAALGRLRDLHSGHPGDYVAWIVVGTAALGGMLAALGLA